MMVESYDGERIFSFPSLSLSLCSSYIFSLLIPRLARFFHLQNKDFSEPILRASLITVA